MFAIIEKIKDLKTAQNNDSGILQIRRRRILPPEDLLNNFFKLPEKFEDWNTYDEDKLIFSDHAELKARLEPGRDPENESDDYLKLFLGTLELMNEEQREATVRQFLHEIGSLEVVEELKLKPIPVEVEMAKKNTAKLKKVEKELNRIEDYLEAESKRKSNPALTINFATFADGTIPNVIDRPLTEWEIMKVHQGVVDVSPMAEHELRTGHANCPESERVPWEVFSSWLSDQVK